MRPGLSCVSCRTRIVRSKPPRALTCAILLVEHDGTRPETYPMLKLLPRVSLEEQSSIHRSFSKSDDAAAATTMAAMAATTTTTTASFLTVSREEDTTLFFAGSVALRAFSLDLATDQTFGCWCCDGCCCCWYCDGHVCCCCCSCRLSSVSQGTTVRLDRLLLLRLLKLLLDSE